MSVGAACAELHIVPFGSEVVRGRLDNVPNLVSRRLRVLFQE